MTRHNKLAIVALAVLVSLAVAGSVLAARGVGASPIAVKPRALVMSPRAGQNVKAYPLTIRLRAGNGLGVLRVTLNGREIGSQFGASRGGVRSLQVSISQGLRRGVNVLRVRARRGDGRWLSTTERFSVSVSRPLAGAGDSARVVVGDPYTLFGAARGGRSSGPSSNPQPAFTAAAQTLHWTLVAHPPNSEPPPLSDPNAPNPTFTPDVPGNYRFSLTVSDRFGSTSDQVTLAAVPRTPLVPIETMAHQGSDDGIRVGDTFYPGRSSFFSPNFNYYHVVVLDRATLGLVSNTTYVCQPPAGCAPGDQIEKDLGRLDNTKLVIAAWHPVEGHRVSTDNLNEFERIGAPKLEPGLMIRPGNVSLIGIPGLPEGQANVKIAPDPPQTNGDMVGYLAPDQYRNFTWLPTQRKRFDTRAPLQPGFDHVFQVGDTLHQLLPQHGTSGFHVVVVDALTLGDPHGDYFWTGSPVSGTDNPGGAAAMAAFLKKVTPRQLVFIAAVGPPGKPTIDAASQKGFGLVDLPAAVASVGGTRDLFNRSGITPDSNYSMVGWGGAGEGHGVETSSFKDQQLVDGKLQPGDGRLRGILTRNNQYLYRPTVVSTTGQPPDALPELMVQPASQWPLAGNKAIDYIGSKVNELGVDPRAAYWNQDLTQAGWTTVENEVKDVRDPGAGHGFTGQEFTNARDELVQEIRWVGKVRAYLTKLSSPLGDTQDVIEKKLETIANQIKTALKPSADQRATLKWLEITDAIAKLAGRATTVTGVIASIYDLGVKYLAEIPNGQAQADAITNTVDGLILDVAQRLANQKASFRSLGDIIVGDYEKLKTAGTLANCSPTASGCPREWQFEHGDADAAATATFRSIEAQFDQALMKVTFPSYVLGPRGDGTQARDYPCATSPVTFYPFEHEPDNGQAALLYQLPVSYDVYALASLSNLTFTNQIPNTPPDGILSRMFGAVSSDLNTGAGGLGIYKPDFMRQASKGDYDDADKPAGSRACGNKNHGGWHNR